MFVRIWLQGLLALTLLVTGVGTPLATPVGTPVAQETPWWQEAACYEVFVRSFADSDGDGIGDFNGLREHLDYLNDGHPGQGDDLGVNCIWLMPIFPSLSYHGYDVTDYDTVNPDYGTEADFRALMDDAHARGIRVIIDLPINHTSSQHPWFQDAITGPNARYRDWYIFEETNPGYTGPWGEEVWHQTPGADDWYYGVFVDSMPDLNLRNPDVNAEIERIVTHWLIDMDVDGFRMDAIKHAIEDGRAQEGTPDTLAWIRQFDDMVHRVKPDAYTVGEVMGSSTDSLQPYMDPPGLDQYLHFTLAQNAVNAARFGQARQLLQIVAGADDRLPAGTWATFLTNHDQPRIASQIGQEPGKLRVAGMLLLSLPGTPFIYYGEEIGMPGPKPDEMIRTPFPWSAEPNGGFTTGTPWEPLQPGWERVNVETEAADPASVLSLYQQWGAVREVSPALQTGTYLPLTTPNMKTIAFLRTHAEQTVLVVINLGADPSDPLELTLPDGLSATTQNLVTGEAGPAVDGGVIRIAPVDGQSGLLLDIEGE